MKLIQDNLWNSKDDIIAVTTNSYINKQCKLVMGRGSALEATKKYPLLQANAAQKITHLGKYGFIIVDGIGLFQVKYHFGANADLELIKYSCEILNNYVKENNKTVSLNYPGIGYGGLSKEVVDPIIRELDNRVTIYHF